MMSFCCNSRHFRILSRRVKYYCDLASIPKRSSNVMVQFSLGLESFRFLLGFEGLVASVLLFIVHVA